MSKTATQLALEYWNKPPIERVNNNVQDYVFDYQQSIIDELNLRIEGLNAEIECIKDLL